MKDDKMLNDELMSEDELDNVVGGTYGELADDSAFLHIYGLCSEYAAIELVFDTELLTGHVKRNAIKAAWAKVNINLEFNEFGDNEYSMNFINGKKLSRAEAYLHVLQTLGDPMTAMLKRQELLK